MTGLSSKNVSGYKYGEIAMKYHTEARQSKDLKSKNGVYQTGEELRPVIRMLHTQIKAAVQGVHFRINELGEIKWLARYD